MGQGDRLDYRRAWTIGSTIELYDPRTKQRQAVPAAGQALTVVAATSGAVVFCVILVDAAGHAGDGDCTGSIALMAE